MKKFAILAALAAAPAGAETITFEADNGVVFARCAPHFVSKSMTICEALFPAGTGTDDYSCVVLDSNGEPIASGSGPDGFFDGVDFNQLDHTKAADMKCRKR